MARHPTSHELADNKDLDEYFGFMGTLIGIPLFTDYFLSENYRFITQPTLIYDTAHWKNSPKTLSMDVMSNEE